MMTIAKLQHSIYTGPAIRTARALRSKVSKLRIQRLAHNRHEPTRNELFWINLWTVLIALAVLSGAGRAIVSLAI
jgi:hypothetical protein